MVLRGERVVLHSFDWQKGNLIEGDIGLEMEESTQECTDTMGSEVALGSERDDEATSIKGDRVICHQSDKPEGVQWDGRGG